MNKPVKLPEGLVAATDKKAVRDLAVDESGWARCAALVADAAGHAYLLPSAPVSMHADAGPRGDHQLFISRQQDGHVVIYHPLFDVRTDRVWEAGMVEREGLDAGRLIPVILFSVAGG